MGHVAHPILDGRVVFLKPIISKTDRHSIQFSFIFRHTYTLAMHNTEVQSKKNIAKNRIAIVFMHGNAHRHEYTHLSIIPHPCMDYADGIGLLSSNHRNMTEKLLGSLVSTDGHSSKDTKA